MTAIRLHLALVLTGATPNSMQLWDRHLGLAKPCGQQNRSDPVATSIRGGEESLALPSTPSCVDLHGERAEVLLPSSMPDDAQMRHGCTGS